MNICQYVQYEPPKSSTGMSAIDSFLFPQSLYCAISLLRWHVCSTVLESSFGLPFRFGSKALLSLYCVWRSLSCLSLSAPTPRVIVVHIYGTLAILAIFTLKHTGDTVLCDAAHFGELNHIWHCW